MKQLEDGIKPKIAVILSVKVEKSGPKRGNFSKITQIFGYTTIRAFKIYNFLLITLFVRLRVYNKS